MVRESPRLIRYLLLRSACMSPASVRKAGAENRAASLATVWQSASGRGDFLRSMGPTDGPGQERRLPIMSSAKAKILTRRALGRCANGRVAQAPRRMRPYSLIPGGLLFLQAGHDGSRSSPRCRKHRPLPVSGRQTVVSSDESACDRRAVQGRSCKRDRPASACPEHRDVAVGRQGTDARCRRSWCAIHAGRTCLSMANPFSQRPRLSVDRAQSASTFAMLTAAPGARYSPER